MGDSVNTFHANIKQILAYSNQLAASQLPLFYFQPATLPIVPVHKFKRIEMPPPEQLRVQQQYRNDFQLNTTKSQRDDGRRQDLL